MFSDKATLRIYSQMHVTRVGEFNRVHMQGSQGDVSIRSVNFDDFLVADYDRLPPR